MSIRWQVHTKLYIILFYFYLINSILFNKVNSVKKDAFPQHNISNAEYKEILIIIYKYKYTFGLAVVGG